MLKHLNPSPAEPERVVIIGAGGFVGSAAQEAFKLEGVRTLPLSRPEIDLLDETSVERLASKISSADTLVVVSAEAPCKDADMLERNVRMMRSVAGAIKRTQPHHVIYVSSDAVYADSTNPLTEDSCAEPGSLHGVMHLCRELILKDTVSGPLAVLRPTLIYGHRDPHNGYGPNRFRRQAAAGEDIVLFGEGEERRDHVDVRDVASLIKRMAHNRSAGVLNAATGTVISFREIANMVASLSQNSIEVKGTPRQGPMPHNGYRAFNSAGTKDAFPDFHYIELADGLAKAQLDMLEEA